MKLIDKLDAHVAAAAPLPWEAKNYSAEPKEHIGIACSAWETFIVGPSGCEQFMRDEDMKAIVEVMNAYHKMRAVCVAAKDALKADEVMIDRSMATLKDLVWAYNAQESLRLAVKALDE